jgi:hypothetical protein
MNGIALMHVQMIKQNEIKMKLKSSSWPMYMEEICIIQIQRPSRAGALGPIFIIIFLNASIKGFISISVFRRS